VSDLTALVLAFEGDGIDEILLLPYFWVPEDALLRKRAHDEKLADLYTRWVREGFVRTTPGNVTDYDTVKRDILGLAVRYEFRQLAIGRLFQGQQLINQLVEEGLDVVPFGQGFFSMAAPSKEFERLVISGKLRHGCNPVLNWMASNVEIKEDPAGNIKPVKPDKEKRDRKIDGIVAAIMALGQQMSFVNEENASVYNERGFIVL